MRMRMYISKEMQQQNLELNSSHSLSFLASVSPCAERDGNAAALAPLWRGGSEWASAVLAEGVSVGPPQTSRNGVHGDSVSSETEQVGRLLATGPVTRSSRLANEQENNGESSSEETREEEAGTQSNSKMAELHVLTELAAIRDKLKVQLQAVSVEESQIQQLARDTAEREVEMKKRWNEMKSREEEMNWREQEMKGREEEMKRREEEMKGKEKEMKGKINKKEKELEEREKGIAHQEEVLCTRELEVARREADVSLAEKGLGGREDRVREMERLACEAHKSLVQCIEQEVEHRVTEVEGDQREEVGRMERILKERGKEIRRLRQCYDAVKQANDSLKKELQEAQEKSSKLQSQLSASHHRLSTAQRKSEQLTAVHQQQQITLGAQLDALKLQFSRSQSDRRKTENIFTADSVCYEVLGAVMGWLCRVHLSQPLSTTQLAAVQQASSKMLPSIASLLPCIPSLSTEVNLQLPVLQFAFWCVFHSTSSKLKATLTSSLRRIGEAVYKPMNSDTDEKAVHAFFSDSDIHIRIVSCLLIFNTLTQVDCLAQVFEQLQQDLQGSDKAKQLFFLYRGVNCILPFMKAPCRVLCTHTVNTYLLLSVESAVLPQFMSALGTEQWFRACGTLLREASDTATLEKMSIILQRLSAMKGIRTLFESQRVLVAVQELLRQRQSDPNSAFLCLNLQSTLVHLQQNAR